MKKSDAHAFINQMLVYTLVMICFSGSVGLGTVWLRHQISVSANHTKLLDARSAEIDRRLYEVGTRISEEQSIPELHRKNQTLALGLVNPQESQIVRITESPEERLAARRNIEIFSLETLRNSTVRFRLAEGGR